MSFYNNRRVSGNIRTSVAENISKAGQVKRFLTRKILFPAIYHFYALRPVKKDKVVFLEIRMGELTDSYQEIFNTLVREYQLDIHCHFFRQGFALRKDELKRQIDYMKDVATARYLILNDSSETQGSARIRRGTKVMNTWHACGAFKKFGNSTSDKLFGDDRKKDDYPLHPRYDLVTVSSPEVEWAYVEAMGKEKEASAVQGIGISRTDVFYRKEFIDASYAHLYDVMPAAKGKKVILYAPTFRGKPRSGRIPEMFDTGMFYEHFRDDYVLIFKHHPLVKRRPQVNADYAEFAVDMTETMSISELLCVADICITDYSSLIFEFAIFERPMIFFAYDLVNYFDWRGFYYNYDELTPGPVCSTNAEMIDFIDHVEERFDRESVIRFRERFMSACDGNATRRIIDTFFGEELTAYRRKEPIQGDYHNLPEVGSLFRDDEKRFIKRLKIMRKGAAAYRKAVSGPVVKGRVVLLPDENSDWDVFESLERAIRDSGQKYEIIHDVYFKKDNISSFMEKMATAEFIICSGEPYVLRMIEVRPETKLIQISPELFPIVPMWNNSQEIRSGYDVRECSTFPIHSRYDLIMGSSGPEDDFFLKNYRLKENGEVCHAGNITADNLFDEEYRKKARNRLELICPYAADKKIILFICRDRDPLPGFLTSVMTSMHEAFAKDHVCMAVTVDGRPGRMQELPEYLEGFGFDPRFILGMRITQQTEEDIREGSEAIVSTEEGQKKAVGKDFRKVRPLTVMELLALADVVVGDYASRMFAAAIIDRPLFLWAPDRVTYEHTQESYLSVRELLPGAICASNRELIARIRDVEHYDMEALKSFRERYLPGNDGKASVRLLEMMGKLSS